MSKKRKTREQKLHAQEKRLNSMLPNSSDSIPTTTYSIALEPIHDTPIASKSTSKPRTAIAPTYVITDLYRSLITASSILVLSALLSLVIKRTNFLSFILN